MKKIYLALVLTTVAQLCHAQAYRRWHFLDPANNPHALRSTAVKVFDQANASGTVGSMIIGTPKDMQGSIPYLSVSNIIDAESYSGYDYFYDFGQTFGPNFLSIDIRENTPVITGYITDNWNVRHLMVMRTNSSGTVLWENTYHFGDEPSQGLDVIYSDDYILLTGFIGKAEGEDLDRNYNKKILVMKLDMNGNVIWQRIFRSTLSHEDTRFDMGNDIQELDKGIVRDPKLPPVSFKKKYLLTGTVTDRYEYGIFKRPIVFCLDDEGDLLWSNMPNDDEYSHHYYGDNSIGTVYSKHPFGDEEGADEGIVYYSFNHGNYGPVITTVSPVTGLINTPSNLGYSLSHQTGSFSFETISGLTLKGGANDACEDYLYLAGVFVGKDPDFLHMQPFKLVYRKSTNDFLVMSVFDQHTSPSFNYFTSRYGDAFDIFWEPYNPASKHPFIHSPKVLDVTSLHSTMVTGVDHYTPALSHELNLFGLDMDAFFRMYCLPAEFQLNSDMITLSDHQNVIVRDEEYPILGSAHFIEKIDIEPVLWEDCSHPPALLAKKDDDTKSDAEEAFSVIVKPGSNNITCEISMPETKASFLSKILVLNMLGQTVYYNDRVEISNNIKSIDLPLQGLATGIYNLVITTGTETVVKKFRIE